MQTDHSLADDEPELTAEEQAQGLLPIREVARQTGINPVTLRAWERRYGLIVPQRTAKGHRLYSHAHIERVRAIQRWLGRGVAVSQIADLLASEIPPASDTANPWEQLRSELFEAVVALAERQLDDLYNRALALYPPQPLCQHLLLPLFEQLEQRWQGQFGASLERVFFRSWLRSKLGARVYHNNRQRQGAPLLLANLSELPMEPGLWLCAWLLSDSPCAVDVLDWVVPPGELNLAVERLKPRAVLLYSSQALEMAQLRRQLPRLHAACPVPLLLAGPVVRIHQEELARFERLELVDTPLEAQQLLQRRGLLSTV
ncbi:MerR family transcriptional regulator [Pseudomonas sp. NW5]|uniref:MerR family transcriptional regulator n=1 Tax=Pseudomonas sp. NW5 TaxID=2934934 RepID=UPI002021BC6D|nr:MerR family transcriptional regulator [Pseudomonas sp. NW5]MCL7461762.1 MerR family transcriptional regulator [Pseudomonas sp. NW5]